jgi:hypothetical protein
VLAVENPINRQIETALSEIFEFAPIGSAVLPLPDSPETDMPQLSQEFRDKRARVLLRESANVTAAGVLNWSEWSAPEADGRWSQIQMQVTPRISVLQ